MNFRERDAVEFKGTGRGLILYINRECSMENIFDSISSKIKSSPNFFLGGVLTDIDSNYISPYQKKLIIEYLNENYGIEYIGVDEFHFNQLMKKKEYKGATAIFKAVRTMYVMDLGENEELDYNGSLVLMTTLPSNSLIKASCDIVVLGSIDVDAKVIAGGNIIVMGEIRGKAYAGAYGNDSACIIARQINAQKIAIFNRESEIVMCKRKTSMSNPEIAYINESGNIVVSQKKEILYKYSPSSIKDTSYGAFDIEEQGVMMEKNQSFSDLAYEIKYSGGTHRAISKEDLKEEVDEKVTKDDSIEDECKTGILEGIIKRVSESMDNAVGEGRTSIKKLDKTNLETEDSIEDKKEKNIDENIIYDEKNLLKNKNKIKNIDYVEEKRANKKRANKENIHDDIMTKRDSLKLENKKNIVKNLDDKEKK